MRIWEHPAHGTDPPSTCSDPGARVCGMGASGDLLREVFDRVNKRDFGSLATELIAPEFVRHDLADLWAGVEGQ